MTADLQNLPDLPALQQLARALWHNGSIRGAALMIGAGFSKNATRAPDTKAPPSWDELLRELIAQLYPADTSAAPSDPLRIAEEFRTYFGQATLDGFIRTRFPDSAWQPGRLHVDVLNLPWSDVLTTNWDTLLERASESVVDYIYEPVRTEADIAHARSPRIIKLHGTLGDKDSLIFAAEDYRTYPSRRAAFVNLARQVFIENDLCLLGFSGNDPNFLEWAGWVRDQLGGHARRIYLAGYLNLPVPTRRYLEARNIAPIDFAPLVADQHPSERHSAAARLFIDALFREKPPVSHEWKLHSSQDYSFGQNAQDHFEKLRNDDAYALDLLMRTTNLLRDDRLAYPGWIVCPDEYRLQARLGFEDQNILRPSVLARLSGPERAEVLREYLWRYTIGFRDLPLLFRDALVALMDDMSASIDVAHRLNFAVALMRDARTEFNSANFEKWATFLKSEAKPGAPELTEGRYQELLYLRDNLDFPALSSALADFTPEGPLWDLRRAGLHAAVGEYREASKLVRDAVSGFEKAHRTNRQSLWATSGLAWASWLARMNALGEFDRVGDLPTVREFRHLKIEPYETLAAIKNASIDLLRKQQADEIVATPLFDVGTYRRGTSHPHAQPESSGLEQLHTLDQLMECVGIPMRMNNVMLAASTAEAVLGVTYSHRFSWYGWLIRTLHSESDALFVRYFSRIAMAQLPDYVAKELHRKIVAAFQFWHQRHAGDRSDRHSSDSSAVLSNLRLILNILSHLTVRISEDGAVDAFRIADKVARDITMRHYWIDEAAAKLANYAIEALSPERQARVAIDCMAYPLSEGHTAQTGRWPRFTDPLQSIVPKQDATDTQWRSVVATLLEGARLGVPTRPEAVSRLSYLVERNILNQSELFILGTVLWEQVESTEGALPAKTHLLDSTFAGLPAPPGIDPTERIKRRIFNMNLTAAFDSSGPLDTSKLQAKKNQLLSLLGAPYRGLKPTPPQAAALFDQIVAWRPPVPEAERSFMYGFKRNFVEFVQSKSGEIVTVVLVPNMTEPDLSDSRVQSLIAFIEESQSWNAIGALPAFVHTGSQLVSAIERVIHRNLISADFFRVAGAVAALKYWAEGRFSAAGKVPRALVETLLSIIETRQQEGLHALLEAATALVKNKVPTDQDIARLVSTLDALRDETKYSDVPLQSVRAVSISLVRQQCVRLAATLSAHGILHEALQGWLEDASIDALPEVRFALAKS